jgi:hypothetical protein
MGPLPQNYPRLGLADWRQPADCPGFYTERESGRYYIWGGRNYISGFEGSQVVPACPSGRGNAHHRNSFYMTWEGLHYNEIWCYQWEGYMWSMQCNVEFRYELCICSRIEENHGKHWWSWSVAGPSGCKLTSSQQSGIKIRETYYFLLLLLVGVRLSPLGTAATTGLLYQPQMIDDGNCGEIGGMKSGRGNRSTRRKPAPAPLCPP